MKMNPKDPLTFYVAVVGVVIVILILWRYL